MVEIVKSVLRGRRVRHLDDEDSRCHQPASCGAAVRSGLRQSIPSSFDRILKANIPVLRSPITATRKRSLIPCGQKAERVERAKGTVSERIGTCKIQSS